MSLFHHLIFHLIFYLWFFLVFYITSRIRKENLDNFVDWIALSFFLILSIWFVWSLFWWQVYWTETMYWIEILYSHPFTPVPYQVPIFPLPIVYSISFFLLFSVLYILSMYIHEKSILWYLGFIIFGSITFSLEFLSWKFDIFKESIGINLTQVFSAFLVFYCIYRLYLLFINDSKKTTVLK